LVAYSIRQSEGKNWVDIIDKGKAKITQGVQGRSLDELEDWSQTEVALHLFITSQFKRNDVFTSLKHWDLFLYLVRNLGLHWIHHLPFRRRTNLIEEAWEKRLLWIYGLGGTSGRKSFTGFSERNKWQSGVDDPKSFKI
jgi:hypothetical protein